MAANLGEFGIAYLIFLFSTTLHEYGHARVSQIFGSDFAEDEGLVTLDPTPHVVRSPIGMVVMPIVSVFFFNLPWPMGWASVPYDPVWAHRHPRQQALMSLAGPAANFFLAAVAFFAIKVLVGSGALSPELLDGSEGERSVMGALAFGLPLMMVINIALGIFNLLPIPPLDGAGVVEGFFPAQMNRAYEHMRQTPAIGWVLFLLAFVFAWKLILPVINLVASWL